LPKKQHAAAEVEHESARESGGLCVEGASKQVPAKLRPERGNLATKVDASVAVPRKNRKNLTLPIWQILRHQKNP